MAFPGENPLPKRIESHSSYKNNERIQAILLAIDQAGVAASNSMQFSDMRAYYNVVEQFYFNVRGVLGDDELTNGDLLVKRYYQIIDILDNDQNARTKKALRDILRTIKQLNLLIIDGLHKLDYFFRMGNRQLKGLRNFDQISRSIFYTGGDKDDQEMDAETQTES